jgi:hypothetical protein
MERKAAQDSSPRRLLFFRGSFSALGRICRDVRHNFPQPGSKCRAFPAPGNFRRDMISASCGKNTFKKI